MIMSFYYSKLLIQSLTEIENTKRIFQEYAAKADFDRFNALLARVPDVEPLPGDELSKLNNT